MPGFRKTGILALLLLAVVLGMMPVKAQAQWTFVAETPKEDLGHGTWKVDRTIKATRELTLSLVFFSTQTTRTSLEVQASPDRNQAKPLSEIAVSHGAIAGCNGGFFSPDFGPAGLEIIQGVRRGEWFKRERLGGTLSIKDGTCHLIPDETFQDEPGITGLVQCSPMLVLDSKATLQNDKRVRLPRTFIATDGRDQWLIGICQKGDLGELSSALASQTAIPEFKVKTALNLDGGPSTCLWWKPAAGNAQSLRAAAVVRNVFLISPKYSSFLPALMNARTLIISLLWMALATISQAQWKVSSQSKIEPLANGAWFVSKQVSGPVGAELKLVFFDSTRCALRIVDQPDRGKAGSLGEAMRGFPAIAGCNGGYFTPEFQPLGMSISQGIRTGKMERSSLLGGVLMVRKGRPMILWRDEFTEQSGITELIQAGPRLVNGGLPVKGLDDSKSRIRTFVLTDCAGHWALGLCDRVSLRQLSDLLATKGIITELDVERALNLDGGSSSGLWYRRDDGQEVYDREFSTVRNFLMVLPKENAR